MTLIAWSISSGICEGKTASRDSLACPGASVQNVLAVRIVNGKPQKCWTIF
jgi:hypothetical protein